MHTRFLRACVNSHCGYFSQLKAHIFSPLMAHDFNKNASPWRDSPTSRLSYGLIFYALFYTRKALRYFKAMILDDLADGSQFVVIYNQTLK